MAFKPASVFLFFPLVLGACKSSQLSTMNVFQKGQRWLVRGEIGGKEPIEYTIKISIKLTNVRSNMIEFIDNSGKRSGSMQAEIRYMKGNSSHPATILASFPSFDSKGSFKDLNTCTIRNPDTSSAVTKFTGEFETIGDTMMDAILNKSESKGKCSITLE